MNSSSLFPATEFSSVRVSIATVLDSYCRLVFELWDSLRGNDFAPSWKDFDLPRLPPHIISFVRVVDVHHAPFDLTYRFWGTGLVRALGGERTGKSLINLSGSRVAKATVEYESVIQEKAPYALVYNAKANRPETSPIYAPAIRLPLTDDGEMVDMVLTYTDFGADQDKWLGIFNDEYPEEG